MHLPFLDRVGVQATSEDETDEEDVHGAKMTVYRTITPGWRSDAFSSFLHFLDRAKHSLQVTPVGKKRNPASHPPPKSKLKSKGKRSKGKGKQGESDASGNEVQDRDESEDEPTTARRRGNQKRPRIHTQERNESIVAPPYLPLNCYSLSWLKEREEWEYAQLKVQTTTYEFPVRYSPSSSMAIY